MYLDYLFLFRSRPAKSITGGSLATNGFYGIKRHFRATGKFIFIQNENLKSF